jgi:hypothetical protein
VTRTSNQKSALETSCTRHSLGTLVARRSTRREHGMAWPAHGPCAVLLCTILCRPMHRRLGAQHRTVAYHRPPGQRAEVGTGGGTAWYAVGAVRTGGSTHWWQYAVEAVRHRC